MAARGKKPTALATRAVKGNPQKRSMQAVVPQAPEGAIPCPDNVMGYPRAKGYWDHYVATTAPGHLCPVDGPMLAALCYYLAKRDDAWAAVEKGEWTKVNVKTVVKPDGTKETSGGQLAQNPAVTAARQYSELARKLAADLALTPAERSRVAPGGGRHGGKAAADEFN